MKEQAVAAALTLSAQIVPPLTPREVRYIKLGSGGKWALQCFERAEIHFGDPADPISFCLDDDWGGARKHMIEALGRGPGPATDSIRELRDFFTLPAGTLWVTFAHGHLWWTECEREVIDLRSAPGVHGQVMRKALGWQKTSIVGKPLRVDQLSTRLSKVAGYQRTICKVEDTAYLLRKINGFDEPSAARAERALHETIASAEELISLLHEREFELLADLLLGQLGWNRVSALGGALPDVDLVVEQLATGERAFVQVKSRATQAVLDDYLARFESSGLDRMFFICHSPKGDLAAHDSKVAYVWTGRELAEKVIRAGLFGWLMERVA